MLGLQNASFQSGLVDERTGHGLSIARHRTFQGENIATEADGRYSIAGGGQQCLGQTSTNRSNLIVTPQSLRCSIAFSSAQDGQTL
ncbi:MAG: hypothetical protein E8D40_15645 [Nitrospira sp.]|nr:MAG: hypothetical protein E8D40_15645 [Nitrospira sp.]